MLRIRPSTEVHPAVVLFIHIVEDDDESLGTLVLAGTELTGIVIAINDVLLYAECGILTTCLTYVVTFLLPVAMYKIHLLVGFKRSTCVPCSESHTVLLRRERFVHLVLVRIVLHHFHHLRAQMLRHELLHVVGRCSHDATAAETYHVRAPAGIVLVDKDGSIRGQLHHVSIILHSHHIDSLTQRSVHITQVTIAVSHGIFTYIDLRSLAIVAVVLVEGSGKPIG